MWLENEVSKWAHLDNEICCKWSSHSQYLFVWKFLEVHTRIVHKKDACRAETVFTFSPLEGFGFQIYIIKHRKRKERCSQGYHRPHASTSHTKSRATRGRSIILYSHWGEESGVVGKSVKPNELMRSLLHSTSNGKPWKVFTCEQENFDTSDA